MRVAIFLMLSLIAQVALAQEPQLSPDAPQDKPASVTRDAMAEFEAAIAPYVAQAKQTYPAARTKFLAGLPNGQSFFVTTRLYDGSGTFEQVFVAVGSIEDKIISGRIWSDVRR